MHTRTGRLTSLALLVFALLAPSSALADDVFFDTQTGSTNTSGGQFTVSFSNLPDSNDRPTVEVRVKGDVVNQTEEVDVSADKTNLGTVCPGTNCADCSNSWQGKTSFTIARSTIDDGKLDVTIDGSNGVNRCSPKLEAEVTVRYEPMLEKNTTTTGGSATLNFDRLKSKGKKVKLRTGVRGDLNSGSETVETIADGVTGAHVMCDNPGDCKQCGDKMKVHNHLNVKRFLSDGKLKVEMNASGAVNAICTNAAVRNRVTVYSGANKLPTAHVASATLNEDNNKSISVSASDPEGAPLTYSVVTPPSHGSVSNSGNTFTYKPNTDYNGSDSFVYEVKDGNGGTDTGEVSLTVDPVADPPVTKTGSVNTTGGKVTLTFKNLPSPANNEQVAVTTSVRGDLRNASENVKVDADSTGLGRLCDDANECGDCSNSYEGERSFTVSNSKVSDGKLELVFDATDKVNICTPTLEAKATLYYNRAPTANGKSVTMKEDTSTKFNVSASDPDGDSLSYKVTSKPSHGTVSHNGNAFTYSSDKDYNGADSFTYQVDDGKGATGKARVGLTITPVNDSPVAQSQSVTTQDNTSTSITFQASDADGDSLSYSIASSPNHGSLSGSGKTRTYSPDMNYTGSDSFDFKVADGNGGTDTATVSITVRATNDAPQAMDSMVTVKEDTTKQLSLKASDPDGDPLAYSIVGKPMHGKISQIGGKVFEYTPDTDYEGNDKFTFQVTDGSKTDTGSVNVQVSPVNDAPTVSGRSLTITEDNSKTFSISAMDVDDSNLTYSVAKSPLNGKVVQKSGAQFEYTPTKNHDGTDKFTLKVADGNGGTDTATVSVTVKPVNDAPVAKNTKLNMLENSTEKFPLKASDPDGDSLSYTVTTKPSHGSLSGSGAKRSYTPDEDYNGSDQLSFRVDDGNGKSDTANVSFTIKAQNSKPEAKDKTITTKEDTDKTFNVQASDPDKGTTPFTLTYKIVKAPQHGKLQGNGPGFTYEPNSDFNGTDSFDFEVSDGTASSKVRTVTINVTSVPDAPSVESLSISVKEDGSKQLTLKGRDADGDALTYSITGKPSNGSLSGQGAKRTYKPDTDYSGSDSFTYKASEKNGQRSSGTATVDITVDPVNDAPTAKKQTVSLSEDGSKQITLKADDPDNSSLTYSITNKPSDGTLTGSAPDVTYKPDANFDGQDSFEFEASDGKKSDTATVTLQVQSMNDKPTWVKPTPKADKTIQGKNAEKLTLQVEADDPETNQLTYTLENGPKKASFDTSTGKFSWTPTYKDEGEHSVKVSASDGTNTIERKFTLKIIVVDMDGDNVPDAQEKKAGLKTDSNDSDDDGISDEDEIGTPDEPRDTDGDGTIDALDEDSDDDGVKDSDEAGDDDPSTDPADTNGDDTPDYRSTDSDGDGVSDGKDNCRLVENDEQKNADDNDKGDACDGDSDGDGVADEMDNCPVQANEDQTNTDDDEKGDVCDSDDDDDGVEDDEDRCATEAAPDQADGCPGSSAEGGDAGMVDAGPDAGTGGGPPSRKSSSGGCSSTGTPAGRGSLLGIFFLLGAAVLRRRRS